MFTARSDKTTVLPGDLVTGRGVGRGCLETSWTVAKYEVLIKAVTVQGLSYRQVAARYGVSKSLVHKLHHRWLTEGELAFEQQSRRPQSSPNRTPQPIRTRIILLRDELVADGLDAGADTITEMLAREGVTISRATVWRLLTAHPRVTGRIVTDTFLRSASEHGYPAATLTDNGVVYTTRLARGGRGRGDGAGNAFETLLADLGIRRSDRLLHLGIGRAHTRAEIICLIHNNEAIISTRDTGEILAQFRLNPAHGHQRKNG